MYVYIRCSKYIDKIVMPANMACEHLGSLKFLGEQTPSHSKHLLFTLSSLSLFFLFFTSESCVYVKTNILVFVNIQIYIYVTNRYYLNKLRYNMMSH